MKTNYELRYAAHAHPKMQSNMIRNVAVVTF